MTDLMKASRVRFAVERLGYVLVDWEQHDLEDHLGAVIGMRQVAPEHAPGRYATWTANFSLRDPEILVSGHYDIPTIEEAAASMKKRVR